MGRWVFVFALFGLMFAGACGLGSVSRISAQVEEILFLVVPSIFTVAVIVGLGMRRQG
jgi:uncharacterized membrane protein YtjA (UPF0391 family)